MNVQLVQRCKLLTPQNNPKVSTPLSENILIGPKVSIFCVASIIFEHCLNPLGQGVHQSFTGCHWSPLPLLHDIIAELVDVRELALIHLPFEDAPQASIGSSPSPLPSASLARQWSLSYWNTALQPCLCFSMSQYMLAFMVPSMNCSSPVSAALVQPQTMTLPPPLYISPGCRHTRLTPSKPNKFVLVSSDHILLFHFRSYFYFPNATPGYNAEHVHSTSLVDHGEACSEWNLSC